MNQFYIAIAVFLLVNIMAGLYRVFRGPAMGDRMLALQLFGTTGVAILILLAESFAEPALRDVALVFALLAVLAMVAYVKLVGPEAVLIREREEA
jgi:multicomponent Na+:H+ antiporter subunit F